MQARYGLYVVAYYIANVNMSIFKKSYAAVVSSTDSESESNLSQEEFMTE